MGKQRVAATAQMRARQTQCLCGFFCAPARGAEDRAARTEDGPNLF
jgi:hypothetical protein